MTMTFRKLSFAAGAGLADWSPSIGRLGRSDIALVPRKHTIFCKEMSIRKQKAAPKRKASMAWGDSGRRGRLVSWQQSAWAWQGTWAGPFYSFTNPASLFIDRQAARSPLPVVW